MPILKSLVFFLLATLVACSDSMNSSELDPNEAVQPEMPMSPAQVPMVPVQEPMVPAQEPMTPEETPDVATTARYRLTFNATWSAETHPTNFPSNPHFSPLVGALHNEQVIFWEAGQLATDGIEVMAETGGTAAFQTEINNAIASGYASTLISEGGIAESPDSFSFEFDIDTANPLVTLTTMVAPSPDWFVGVHDLPLFVDGAFIDELTVELAVYDSGSDSGTGYVSANADTQPPEPIMLLTSQPSDAPFVDGRPIVGTFFFEKL